jgi:hypothetical protein
VNDVQEVLEKVRQYAIFLYTSARAADGEHRMRKYSRKLKKLTDGFPRP